MVRRLALLAYAAVLALSFWADLRTKPVGTDEAFTYYQVASKSWSQLVASYSLGVNALPFPYFALLWLIDHSAGLGTLALRLPSFLFALATLVCLHRLLAKRLGDVIAFLACSGAVLLVGDFRYYAAEARPYTAYLFFALMSLASGAVLVREDEPRRRDLILNGVASFLLPSVHYVGLLYSALVATAVTVSLPKGVRRRVVTLSSFAAGWLAFGVVNASQSSLFLCSRSLVVAWIDTPRLGTVLETAISTLSISPLIPAAFLALAMLTLFGGRPAAAATAMEGREVKYLVAVSAVWLLLPAALHTAAALGLPNLALSRYTLPTLLATSVVSAIMLALLCPAIVRGIRASAIGGPWRGGSVAALALGGVFILSPVLQDSQRIETAAPDISAAVVAQRYGILETSALPCVTGNLHIFFTYTYHKGTSGKLYLLRKTSWEAEGFRLFHPKLASCLVRDDLRKFPAFAYIHSPESPNNYPDFDINNWCAENGYKVVETQRMGLGSVFVVRRIEAGGAGERQP